MPSATRTPEYWLERAEEARTHAAAMVDRDAKRQLLVVAEDERLADYAERTAGRKAQRSRG